jgi:hypothetical protein
MVYANMHYIVGSEDGKQEIAFTSSLLAFALTLKRDMISAQDNLLLRKSSSI